MLNFQEGHNCSELAENILRGICRGKNVCNGRRVKEKERACYIHWYKEKRDETGELQEDEIKM